MTETNIQTFADQLSGDLIRPGDNDYDEARAVWNGMIDKRPAFIARCTNNDDVIAAVKFARRNNLLVSVRGGGHNAAGYATNNGGLVIDLSPLKNVQVDPVTGTVRAAGGVTIGDIDQATQKYGLAVPMGVVTETGIAGLTLSGGYGWMRNKYGLTCDNLVAAEMVTADGRLVQTNESENADLLWGLRGGGGNFGIVTLFEYQAYPIGPDVMFSAVFHDGRHMKEGLQFFREYCATAPDEISILAVCGQFPPGEEIFPEEVHGLPYLAFIGAYIGPAGEGREVIKPLREFRQPLVDFSDVMPYLEAQQFFDEDYPAGELRYYWKSTNLLEMSDAAIERIAAHAVEQPSPLSTTDIWHVGGAIRRKDEDDAAFVGRHVPFLFNAEANWEDPEDDEANINWARQFVDSMREYSDGSRYFNFPGLHEEGEMVVRDTYGAKYERLVALKNKYDPTNFFRLNANIEPTH